MLRRRHGELSTLRYFVRFVIRCSTPEGCCVAASKTMFYFSANVYNDVPHWTLTYCFPLTM